MMESVHGRHAEGNSSKPNRLHLDRGCLEILQDASASNLPRVENQIAFLDVSPAPLSIVTRRSFIGPHDAANILDTGVGRSLGIAVGDAVEKPPVDGSTSISQRFEPFVEVEIVIAPAGIASSKSPAS
jgi:hypothetical protein